MLYDMDTALHDADGTPVLENDKYVPMRVALVRALLAEVSATGGQLMPDDKLKRYQLFKKIAKQGAADLSVEEASLAASAAAAFPPLVYGQIKDFLDNPKT